MPDSPTLHGRTIAVTRAAQQLRAARRLFEAAGAAVVDLPALVIGPPDDWGPRDDALAELDQFHWLVFSSGNGVEAVHQRLGRLGSSSGRKGARRKARIGSARSLHRSYGDAEWQGNGRLYDAGERRQVV